MKTLAKLVALLLLGIVLTAAVYVPVSRTTWSDDVRVQVQEMRAKKHAPKPGMKAPQAPKGPKKPKPPQLTWRAASEVRVFAMFVGVPLLLTAGVSACLKKKKACE